MKQTNCTVDGCPNKGRYCRQHLSGIAPKKQRIDPRSAKMEKLMRKEYVPQVKEAVAAGTACAIKTEVCTGFAQGFHHPFGKASEELRLTNKVPCCNPCNVYIEANDAYARQMGWKKSKFSIPAKNQKIGQATTAKAS